MEQTAAGHKWGRIKCTCGAFISIWSTPKNPHNHGRQLRRWVDQHDHDARLGGAMTEWTFRLTLAGLDLTDEQLNALFEAGCDDATFSLERDGSVLGLFDREAETQEDAVLSAIDNV